MDKAEDKIRLSCSITEGTSNYNIINLMGMRRMGKCKVKGISTKRDTCVVMKPGLWGLDGVAAFSDNGVKIMRSRDNMFSQEGGVEMTIRNRDSISLGELERALLLIGSSLDQLSLQEWKFILDNGYKFVGSGCILIGFSSLIDHT